MNDEEMNDEDYICKYMNEERKKERERKRKW